jgi:hypothetical protein
MDLKKILGNLGCTALGTVAPPFGGMAAKVLKDVLNLDEKATEPEIITAVSNATPEQLGVLKDAENKFKIDMEKLGVNVLKLDKEDRDSARDMKIKTKSYMPDVLSVMITAGFFAVLYLITTNVMPEGAPRDAVLIMFGALASAFTQVVNFWLGSSDGSKAKTDLMGKK